MQNVEKIREQFPITKHKVYLNHAAESPLPKPAADAVREYIQNRSVNGPAHDDDQSDYGKSLFAKLIGATPREIAVIENTSVGLNIIANMLDYKRATKVVTTDLEFPSVVYPWLRKGLGTKVHYVRNVDGRISLNDMERAIDDSTAAVAISHVEYCNGFLNDLKAISEMAHEHGAYLIVDAIQSVGALKVDVKRYDVDFLATACYKWLLGPPGAGYFYVKNELIEKFEPPFAGWASVRLEIFETADFWDIWNLPLSDTASRFEVGTPSRPSFEGAAASVKMLLEYGAENVEKRIMKLTDALIEQVKECCLSLQTPEEQTCRSGIVNFKIDRPAEVVKMLSSKGIVTSARSNGIRVSPHFYNTEEEIEKLIEEIRKTLR